MANGTTVVTLSEAEADLLDSACGAEGMAAHRVAHARFGWKGEGVTIVCYRSMKCVAQGRAAAVFLGRVLGADRLKQAPAKEDKTGPLVDRIGADESGKGDYFGPLVVAAVFCTADEQEAMRGGEIRDCKAMSLAAVRRTAEEIRGRFPYATRLLEGEDYNAAWEKTGNVNHVLSDLHAEAIVDVAEQTGCRRVLLDRFGKTDRVEAGFESLGAVELVAVPRAEANPSVAAASILARDLFLDRLAALAEEMACDLHPGAGDPVLRCARRLIEIHGPDGLRRCAKVHFKTTDTVLGPS